MRNENIEWITIRKADYAALAARLGVRDAEREALLVACDDFSARLAEAEALLRPLTDIPLEDFGKERKPDYPLMGWNNHTIYVRDVLAARAFLSPDSATHRENGSHG